MLLLLYSKFQFDPGMHGISDSCELLGVLWVNKLDVERNDTGQANNT